MHLLTSAGTPAIAIGLRARAIAIDAAGEGITGRASTALPFPTSTLAPEDTRRLLVADWGLGKGRVQDGEAALAFVADPFPEHPVPGFASARGTVLRVTYAAGSFSHDTGGAQFYNLWNDTAPAGSPAPAMSDLASADVGFGSLLLEYEVAFDAEFDWVKGGKLPGLRGGLDSTGCSGGNEPAGDACFSTRLMWRKGGEGEVYAYIPTTEALCEEDEITCNDDYGVSIARGSFGLVAGKWNRIALLIQLNDPPSASNGIVQLYYNGLPALTQQNLRIRTTSDVLANGLFFSTFFGGADSTWATTNTTHTYFRNIGMWGSSQASTGVMNNHARRNGGPDMLTVLLAMGLAAVAAWAL
ncbi:polysaccharide lyase family 14 protein [Schizophyllum fasciatum]